MVRKGNHWIFLFIGVGQCSSISTQLKLLFRGFIHVRLYIYFLICSVKIKFPFLKQCWKVDLLDLWCNICTKDGDNLFLSFIEFLIGIGRMIIWIDQQVLQCIWSGRNGGRTYHDFVWIDCYFCTNSVFYLIWKSF